MVFVVSVPYDGVQERACLVFFGWIYITRISALGHVHANHMVSTKMHFINSCSFLARLHACTCHLGVLCSREEFLDCSDDCSSCAGPIQCMRYDSRIMNAEARTAAIMETPRTNAAAANANATSSASMYGNLCFLNRIKK